MHELKIIQDIFPQIENLARENNLATINQVTLSIGQLRQIQGDFLRFAFESVSKGTILQGAKLTIKLIPVVVWCESCKKQFAVDDNVYICPICGNTSLQVLTGKEIILESIDGERG